MNLIRPGELEFLSSAKDTVLENLDNDQFNVTGMAGYMGMSRSTLHRKLKSVAGVTTNEFIRTCKLERAEDLLKTSSANITEIAFECGFRSLNYFDVCFKDHFGYSPSKFRKEFNKEADLPSAAEAFPTTEYLEDESGKSINQLHNFPAPVTSFIGRRQEMEFILELLKEHRLISLVGAGGCGKTRLACEAVARLDHEFTNGIWFVDLAPIELGEFVPKEIMKTLKIPESPGKELMDTLEQKLKGMKMLIILDNCEHLATDCAATAGRLLQSVSGLSILTTSRMVLNIKSEKIWRIPSLNLVNPEKVTKAEHAERSEAVRLFVDRAQLHDPDFQLVDENSRAIATICKQIDGIPLAIELVAIRSRNMEPATMLERLSGRFSELDSNDPIASERHRTLNATIDWSYNLLLDEEKVLFSRLSLFSGGFDLEAVEVVCADVSLPEEYILDVLSNLVDRSMIHSMRLPGHTIRYSMLETLRQYASGLLEKKEEIRLRKKHLKHYSNIAEKAYQERMNAQSFWLQELDLEHDNMIAALNWSQEHYPAQFRWLAGELAWFWSRSDNNHLARKILGSILTTGKVRSEAKARILSGYSWANNGIFDEYLNMIENFKQCVSIWHRLGNTNEEAISLADLALTYYGSGQDETGLKHAYKANDLAKINDDPGVVLYCMLPLSQGLVNLKRTGEAKSQAKKVRKMAEELENPLAQFYGNHNYGDCCLIEGNFTEAEKSYAKGVEVTSKYGEMYYLFTEITGIAMAAAGMGRYPKALRLVGAANNEAEKAGTESVEKLPLHFWQELVKQYIAGTREKLGEDLTSKYEAEGRSMNLEEVMAYALDFTKD